MCGPVFNEFMKEAVKKYGGGPFRVPPGGHFISFAPEIEAKLEEAGIDPTARAETVSLEGFCALARALDKR